MIFLMSF